MAKNIVICSDGTGNTAIKGRGTNVFKLFEAVDLNGHRTDSGCMPQIALYDDGVGTESFKPVKVLAGATGYGLSRNVKQLYKELCRVYDPGDRIFLFGFSRGAFTVRTLVGFIARCGILRVDTLTSAAALESAVHEAYRTYRRCYRPTVLRKLLGDPDTSASAAFKSTLSHEGEPRIAFLGVWDTVDAVGLPFHLSDVINSVIYQFKFSNREVSPIVERACHAVAIDDQRHSFHPVLWDVTKEPAGRVEQVWFAGAHSNVGGGYAKQGMSLVALDWMMTQAEAAGLRFVATDRAYCRDHASSDDKLYDPRAGLGIFYRWKPRDVAALCAAHGVPASIHLSVLERLAHGTEDYVPGNLPFASHVVVTSDPDARKQVVAVRRAMRAEAILRANPDLGPSLLAQPNIRRAIVVGRVSYYVYLLACLATLLAVASPEGWGAIARPGMLLRNVGTLIAGLLTAPFDTALMVLTRLWSAPDVLLPLVPAFLAAYLMALHTDMSTSGFYSRFWHRRQQDLRSALRHPRDPNSGSASGAASDSGSKSGSGSGSGSASGSGEATAA